MRTVFVLILLLQQAPPAGLVNGRVVDALTGTPVPGALIEVLPVRVGELPRRVEAGLTGEFQIRDVSPGTRLAVTAAPLTATHVPQVIQPEFATASRELVVSLEPALAIDGRVIDERAVPMANVRVIAEAVGQPADASRERRSDDSGMFRLFGLRAARYQLCAIPERPGATSTYGKTCSPPLTLQHNVETAAVTIQLRRSTRLEMPAIVSETAVTIRGRVSDEQTRTPLAGALVSFVAGSAGAPHEAIADEQGRFQLRVPPGPYDLRATAGEFAATHVAYKREILVMADDLLGDLDIILARAAAIDGRVGGGRGTLLAGVGLELFPDAGTTPLKLDYVPTSDDRGYVRAHGLAPGRYTACASPPGAQRHGSATWSYGRECYPFPFAVRAATAARVGITLQRIGTHAISGKVTGLARPFPEGAMVSAVLKEPYRIVRVPIAADGAFSVSGLIPGVYDLGYIRVLFGRSSTQPALWGTTQVEIVDADVTDVVLQLSEGAAVHGRVIIDEPGSDRSLRGIKVRAAPVGGRQGNSDAGGETDEDGVFILRGVFGSVVLRVSTPQDYDVQSIRYAGRDITDLPTVFDANSPSGVDVVLTRPSAGLSGRVLDDQGRAVEDAGVLYFPADPARWKAYDGGVRQQSIGGGYKIDKLVGGDYYVIAVTGPRPGWTEKDYAALAPRAHLVTLQRGERRALDLHVVALGR